MLFIKYSSDLSVENTPSGFKLSLFQFFIPFQLTDTYTQTSSLFTHLFIIQGSKTNW